MAWLLALILFAAVLAVGALLEVALWVLLIAAIAVVAIGVLVGRMVDGGSPGARRRPTTR
jgi:hypothetical protein